MTTDNGEGKWAVAGLEKPYLSRVWALFSSLRLTIFLMITLAVVAVIGTVIQQGKEPDLYIKEYGERIYALFDFLGATDMYHAWWFILLLGLLSLNIIVCTIDRLPSKWRAVHKRRLQVPLRFVENLPNNAVITGVRARPPDALSHVLDVLRERRYHYEISDASEDITVMGYKGMWGRFGSDLTHLGIIVILLGAILGSILGFKGFQPIPEGETEAITNTHFQVRVNRFWIDYYDTGQVKQYYSDLTVMEGGKEVLNKIIYVNEPLAYKGVRIFQSSYGLSWSRIKTVKLTLIDRGSKELIEKPFEVKWEEKVIVPTTKYEVKLVGFVSDFAFDIKNRTVYAKSADHNNPAVQLQVYQDDKMVATRWVFLQHPGLIPVFEGEEPYDLAVVDYQRLQYTGLQINKDPGVNMVWVGSAIMCLGFLLAFFVFYKRLWIKITSGGGNGVDVYVGGLINKNHILFDREFQTITGSLTERLEGGAQKRRDQNP